MTNRETLAGHDDIAEDSGTLGLNLYEYTGGTMQTVFNSANLGQGSGAVAWLTGDFFGAGESGIAQLWDNNGRLGLNIYLAFSGVQTAFSSADLGQGSGAVAWLPGDFTGSGRAEIAQPWDNNGTLALNIFRYTGDTVETVESSAGLGQGPGALAWLTGDFYGFGRSAIAQLWDNNGRLGLNIYLAGGFGPATVFSSSDLGEGSGALAWLPGDFTGSGQTEIAQLWDNNGTVALNIYLAQADGTVQNARRFINLGQGPGAVAWLAGDFTGSGQAEIAQLWDNNGNLALNIYQVTGGRITPLEFPDLGQGPGAVAWLTGDFTGSGHTEIAQLWDNNGNLALIVYRVSGNTATEVINTDLGQGPGALTWLADNFTGSGLTVIAQPWDS